MADLVPQRRLVTAYGVFAAFQGVAALAGGTLAGGLYNRTLLVALGGRGAGLLRRPALGRASTSRHAHAGLTTTAPLTTRLALAPCEAKSARSRQPRWCPRPDSRGLERIAQAGLESAVTFPSCWAHSVRDMDDLLAVDAQGVTKTYGSLRAVDDISVRVVAGEVYGVLGPNGAGMTTFLRMLFGLIQFKTVQPLSSGLVAVDFRESRVDGWVGDGAMRVGRMRLTATALPPKRGSNRGSRLSELARRQSEPEGQMSAFDLPRGNRVTAGQDPTRLAPRWKSPTPPRRNSTSQPNVVICREAVMPVSGLPLMVQ